jgi:hypothetical protein
MSRRCPDRAASTTVVGPVAMPHVAWTAAVSALDLAVAADGTIYTVTNGVTALTPTGSVRWQTPQVGGNGLAIGADGTVYVGAGTGGLSALRPDGTIAWAKPTCCSSVPDSEGPCGTYGFTLGAAQTIYAFEGDCDGTTSLAAYAASGTLQWRTPLDLSGGFAPAVGHDGNVYVLGATAEGSELVAAETSGAIAWRIPSSATVAVVVSTPVAELRMTSPIVTSDGSILYADSAGLHVVAPDGSARWSRDANVGGPLAAGSDGTAYDTEFGPAALFAIRPDGGVAWDWLGSNLLFGTRPIVGGDGTVYLAIADDSLSGTFAISSTGTLLWSLDGVGAPQAIGPDGTLYTLGGEGSVTALRP